MAMSKLETYVTTERTRSILKCKFKDRHVLVIVRLCRVENAAQFGCMPTSTTKRAMKRTRSCYVAGISSRGCTGCDSLGVHRS